MRGETRRLAEICVTTQDPCGRGACGVTMVARASRGRNAHAQAPPLSSPSAPRGRRVSALLAPHPLPLSPYVSSLNREWKVRHLKRWSMAV